MHPSSSIGAPWRRKIECRSALFGAVVAPARRVLAQVGAIDRLVDHVSVAPLLASLPERDRRILSLRFFKGWTQSQIAADIGVTQMQVSRLLSRTLERLRVQLEDAEAA